jgi:cytochrome c
MITARVFSSLLIGLCAAAALAGCSGGADSSSETSATESVTPAAAALEAVAYASLKGDAAAGEKTFGQCRACHQLIAGKNGIGPSLAGIVGRTAGKVAGFNYSVANKASGTVWSEDALYAFMEAPQKLMPGTKMAFAGLKKPQDRADVIAYLKTQP